MREIKFRAWNKPTNKMFYWGTIQLMDQTDKRNIEEVHNIFMQFTGLKDRNGKEIYEGDIISDNITKRTEHLGYVMSEVIYQEELACFSIATLSEDKKERFIAPIHYLELDVIPNKYEVIGNIFENPELLTK